MSDRAFVKLYGTLLIALGMITSLLVPEAMFVCGALSGVGLGAWVFAVSKPLP